MNMRSIITSADDEVVADKPTVMRRIMDWANANRGFLLVVVLPTLLLTSYLYLVSADQYQSEAHFIIRKSSSSTAPATGFGEMLGLVGGATQTQTDAASVSDYLTSHDAVAALNAKTNLIERFRRPEADPFSRLNTASPTPEKLLKYYKKMVLVHTDRDTGITILQVRAFRRDDAYDIIQSLLQLGEQQVNALNERSFSDAVKDATLQLTQAENAVADVQSHMTNFRQSRGDIDPQWSGEAQVKLVTELNGNLASARAQLNAMGASISHSSPQYLALDRQVRSLETQAAVQSNRAAGSSSKTIATNLGGYEDLKLRQEFAAKRYDAAAANLEKARADAQRQQLYLVRIVDANRPVKSLYPERGRVVLTVFIGLLLIYSIGWLIAAGVREHAA